MCIVISLLVFKDETFKVRLAYVGLQQLALQKVT